MFTVTRDILHQIFSEICADRVFKLSLEHNVFSELILIRVKEERKQLCYNITF